MASKSFWPTGRLPLGFAQLSLLFLSCLIAFSIIHLFGGPLTSIPGPLTARLSRLWMVRHSRKGDMHRTMISLHMKYGKLVRTGPNELSVSDLSAIKKIYGAGSQFVKSDWYSVWQGHRKFDLFPERDERIHSAQRRLVSRIYSMKALQDFEGHVDDTVAQFVKIMDERKDQSIDLGLYAQLFAFGQSSSTLLAPSSPGS